MLKPVHLLLVLVLLLAGCTTAPEVREVSPAVKAKPPKIAIALGGGAAKGFAHVGVLKTLEAHGIPLDYVAGTSAGSVVGVLYAGGFSGYDLQKVALQLEQDSVSDFALPNRGFVKGELLQNYVNKALRNRAIDALNKPFSAVATDLQSGEAMVFQRGNAGMAVRASSSVPGVFQPVNIGGRDYVDGGLVSPVPVRAARAMGADIVIAVDISSKPRHARVKDTLDILLQTFNIMGQGISRFEMAEADVVIQPNLGTIGSTEFDQKHTAIMEGEKAALAALPAIREKIRKFTVR